MGNSVGAPPLYAVAERGAMGHDDAQMLTVAETAARLHVSEATIYRHARRGLLPGAVRVGPLWRFDPSRLDAGLFAAPTSVGEAGDVTKRRQR